jgi:cysteine desulfuration protein SufE
MFDSCLKKQAEMKALFQRCDTIEDRYQKIIDLGRTQAHLNPLFKNEANLVHGCQSRMYLHSWLEAGLVYFEAESDAIISSGLGMLLIRVYSRETPETILKCPPTFIDELGIPASLTPGRANGLASIYLRMKQEALQFYMQKA